MPKRLRTEANGRQLAIDLLREFKAYEQDDAGRWKWNIEAMHRAEGTPQENVVLRYIHRCATPDVLAGFCSVLTDYVGSCETCGTPDPEIYERLTERDMTGKPGPWPNLESDEEERRRRDGEKKAAFQGFMQRLNLRP